MKIGFSALQYSKSGAGISRYIGNLVQSMMATLSSSSLDVEIRVLIRGSELDGFRSDHPRVRFLPVPLEGASIKRNMYEQTLALKRLGNVDLIHYPDAMGPMLSRKPFVITIHDLSHFVVKGEYGPLQGLWKRTATNVSVRRAHRILTVSEFTRTEIERILGVRGKVTVTYNGFDAQQFKEPNPQGIALSPRLRLLISKPYILYVGTLEPRKNLERLVEAFEGLKGSHDIQLVLAGKVGWKAESLLKRVAGSKNEADIVMPGFVSNEELPGLYANAEVMAYVSLYEGFGFPPLEALATGCPVVASSEASIPEVCGDLVTYVQPENVAQIKNALEKSMGVRPDDRRVMEWISQFSWAQTATQTLQSYAAALGVTIPMATSPGLNRPL